MNSKLCFLNANSRSSRIIQLPYSNSLDCISGISILSRAFASISSLDQALSLANTHHSFAPIPTALFAALWTLLLLLLCPTPSHIGDMAHILVVSSIHQTTLHLLSSRPPASQPSMKEQRLPGCRVHKQRRDCLKGVKSPFEDVMD